MTSVSCFCLSSSAPPITARRSMSGTNNDQHHQTEYSIAVRFGHAVLEAGHTAIPNLVLRYYARLGVTTGELVFMTLCLQLKWSKDSPHPSLGLIAERMGVSRRQVRTYASSLRAKGLLVVEERTDPERGQLSSLYDFTPLINAVVHLEGGAGDAAGRKLPPWKYPSEGGRKSSSEGPRRNPSALQEDQEEEYSVMQSSRFTTFERKSAHARAGATPTSGAPASPLATGNPEALRELVRRRFPASPPPAPGCAPSQYLDRPYLDSLIRGVSQIFDDTDNLDANLVRAHRLQERYRLDEETFSQCVFRARSLVKERRLTRRGGSVRRPGAYFFTILEGLAAEANGHGSARKRLVPASESGG